MGAGLRSTTGTVTFKVSFNLRIKMYICVRFSLTFPLSLVYQLPFVALITMNYECYFNAENHEKTLISAEMYDIVLQTGGFVKKN